MIGRRLLSGSALLLALLGAPACTSRDEKATTAAGIAADALQQGDLATARAQIGRALAARDDVGDYWLLSGRIALAEGKYPGAYDAFENALTLDRSNVEALTRLCQLAVSGGRPERAERYAEQLAALRPGDTTAVNVRAALALDRGDKPGAARLLDQLLAAQPGDPMALITRSRLFSANDDYAAAAKAAEASLAAPGDPSSRLQVLKEAYRKAGDAAGFRRTVARLARAMPRSASAQLDLARSLYDSGDRAAGVAATRRVLALRPGDVATADTVLRLWLAQGAAAMPVDAIVAGAANGVAETRAAYAAYANALRRPDLALAALGEAGAADPPGTAVNDAKVARAQAQALLGRRDAAARAADAVLAADPDQPRALALRGSLRAAAGDRAGAVEDLRHALASAPANADARLALADLQVAEGDGVLAVATLQDGLKDPGADPRLAMRLAALLRGQGRADEAGAVLAGYRRDNPFAPPAG